MSKWGSVQWLNKQTGRKISTNWRKWAYRAETRGLYVEYYEGVIFCGVSGGWDEKYCEWEGVRERKEERWAVMVKRGHWVWCFTTGGNVGSSGWIPATDAMLSRCTVTNCIVNVMTCPSSLSLFSFSPEMWTTWWGHVCLVFLAAQLPEWNIGISCLCKARTHSNGSHHVEIACLWADFNVSSTRGWWRQFSEVRRLLNKRQMLMKMAFWVRKRYIF